MIRFFSFVSTKVLKTFDVREGEYQRVLLLQLNIFIIIFSLLIIKPVVNAQFISVIGVEQLPLVFVLVAVTAMAVSTLYSKALSSKSLQRLTNSTLLISIISLVIIALLLKLDLGGNVLLYLLYIGTAIFGVLTTSQFWIMANLAFDAREAKRLFSFIGAGAIAGGVAGGYLTSVLVNYLDSIDLLFVAAVLISACIPINNLIWNKHIAPLTVFQKKKRLKSFGDHPLWIIRQSKHLSYLAIIIGLSVLVSKLVDFQFSSVAAAAFEDPEELTAFFGFWFSTFNLVSLGIQLFLTRRIVGTHGVGTSLFALPGGVMVGSLMLLFAPVLWAGIFTKLWEVSVKQSINKSATELLALPIPATIKSQTKSFIDVFVDLAATGLAGLLLIFLVNGFALSIRAISILTMIMLIAWIWVAILVRREYINSFKSKLTQADKEAERELPDFANKSVISGIKRALENGTEDQILYVLEKVREIPDKRLFDNISTYLSHSSPKIRQQALQTIYYLETKIDNVLLEHLLLDDEQEVRYKAFALLLKQNNENRISTITKYLCHQDPLVSGAALVGLAEEARNNPEMKKLMKVEQHIQEKIDYLALSDDPADQKQYKIMILRAAGHANLEAFYPTIMGFFEDKDSTVRHEAIKAAGLTMNIAFVIRICEFLVAKDTRRTAQDALLHYGVGIIPVLENLVIGKALRTELMLQVPAVLESIDSQATVEALLGFLKEGDLSLRLEALRSLNAVQRDFPQLQLQRKEIFQYIVEETSLYKDSLGVLYKQRQLLSKAGVPEVNAARESIISLLERRLDSTLERIFRLIGLRYPPDDIITVYQGIKSVNESTRINSVEYLDNLLEPSLKKALVPIAETAIFEAITTNTIENLKVQIPDERRCFELILKGKDTKLKLAVFQLMLVAQMQEYLDLVVPLTDDKDSKVSTNAKRLVSELS